MAKAIWWLTVIVVALINNIEPFHMNSVPLTPDKYYASAYGEDIDPKAFYQTFFSAIDEGLSPCHPEAQAVPQSFGKTFNGYHSASNTVGITYFLPTGGTQGDVDKAYNVKDAILPIVAPMACKIVTNPEDSGNSTTMVVETMYSGGRHYTIEFHYLDHWYCCHGNPKYKGKYKHYGVDSSSYPNIQEGQVLGYATADTYIFIFDNDGKQVDFDAFYGFNQGTYTTLLDGTNRVATTEAQ